jgi:hypothetical protein
MITLLEAPIIKAAGSILSHIGKEMEGSIRDCNVV